MTGPLPFWVFELVLTAFMSMSAWSLARTVRQLDEIERRLRATETRLAVVESALYVHRRPFIHSEARADA